MKEITYKDLIEKTQYLGKMPIGNDDYRHIYYIVLDNRVFWNILKDPPEVQTTLIANYIRVSSTIGIKIQDQIYVKGDGFAQRALIEKGLALKLPNHLESIISYHEHFSNFYFPVDEKTNPCPDM